MTRFQYEVQYFHYSYFKQVAGSINVHGSIFAQTGFPETHSFSFLFFYFTSYGYFTILSAVLLMLFVFLSVTMD